MNPQLIVDTRIMLVQAGLDDITTIALESHYLAGGNVPLVIRALIAAHRAQIPSTGKQLRPLTLLDEMCWKPCRPALRQKSLIARTLVDPVVRLWTAWHATEFN